MVFIFCFIFIATAIQTDGRHMIDTILLLATVFAGIAAIGYFVDVSFKTLGNKLHRAYSIAVIGFPKSGKTTENFLLNVF